MRNPKKIAIIVGVILLATIATLVYLVLWTGSTKEIEAIADKFQPGESWTLVSEKIKPPQYLCLDGGGCPQLVRQWESNEALTIEELENIASRSIPPLEVKGDCLLNDTSVGSISLCRASGEVDEFSVYIDYQTPDANKIEPKLSISIRK